MLGVVFDVGLFLEPLLTTSKAFSYPLIIGTGYKKTEKFISVCGITSVVYKRSLLRKENRRRGGEEGEGGGRGH